MVLLTSRSPRDVVAVFARTTTGPRVGPDRYDCRRWGDGEVACAGGALGKDLRPPMTEWSSKAKNPGPGTYNVAQQDVCEPGSMAQPFKRNLAGVSTSAFRSQTIRISADNLREPLLVPGSSEFTVSTAADNPGPGEYEPPRGVGEARRRPATSQGMEDRAKRTASSAILRQTTPSFPPTRDLQRQRYSGRRGDSVAPGDYAQTDHSAMRSSIAHQGGASDFHSSGTDRLLVKDSNQPGPGAYNTLGRLRRGTSMPFLSGTPQLHTAQPVVTSSCSPALTPGPGEYPLDASGAMEGVPSPDDRPAPFPGLRSKTERQGWWRSLEHPFTEADTFAGRVPGPAHYAEKKPNLKELTRHRRVRSTSHGLERRKYHGVHAPQQLTALKECDGSELAGFGCSATRPCLDEDKEKQAAGPATYDPSLSIGQSVSAKLREAIKIGKGGAFGGSRGGDRFAHGMLSDRNAHWPAPHDYGLAMRRYDSLAAGGDSSGGAFRSKVKQLSVVGIDRTPRPGPGAYQLPAMCSEPSPRPSPRPAAVADWPKAEVSNSVSRSVSDPALPRARSETPTRGKLKFKQRKTDHLSFGAGSSRATYFAKAGTSNPAPGCYDPRLAQSRVGAIMTTADRGLEPTPPELLVRDPTARHGPGTYEVQGSLLNRTFNTSGERAANILLQHGSVIIAAAAKRTPHRALPGGAGGGAAARDAVLARVGASPHASDDDEY